MRLYQKVADFFVVTVEKQEEILREKTGVVLLRNFLSLFKYYTTASKMIKKIFQYMHRYWIPAQQQAQQEKKVRDVDVLSLVKWRTHCYDKLKPKILAALLDLADLDRNGETVDKSLFSNMVQAYIQLGVNEEQPVLFYQTEFQDPFIARTEAFYIKESDNYLQENSVSQYMQKAEERLKHEEGNARGYLHPETEPVLQAACESVLIERHNEILQNEFQTMLRDEKEDDMQRFYFLLSRIDSGLNASSATMKNFLKEVGNGVIVEQSTKLDTKKALKNSVPFMHELLAVHKKYVGIIRKCFSDHKLFIQAMDEAFTFFVNKEVGVFSMAELLNFFVDHVLKGNEKLAEDQLEETLEATVRLFTYFDDKDVFYMSFRRSLSKRLLSRKVNEDAERSFIGKLKMSCGDAYTKKLEGMFNDIKLASEKQQHFKNWMVEKGNTQTVDLSVMVLNDLYWPLSKQTELQLPTELIQCVGFFEEYYHTTTEKRKLKWIYNQGTISVYRTYKDAKGRARRLECVVSCIQACILNLFNDNNEMTFKEAQKQLNLSPDVLKFSIHPLIFAKSRLLTRKKIEGAKPVGRKPIDEEDIFVPFNFRKVPKNRIQYPPGSTRLIKKESKEVQDRTKHERIIKIELSLVRVMKARNVLSVNELITEASKQLLKFFRPDPRLVKKRIETLMERGFMRRDDADQKVIHYVA